jgi:plastocyanin
MALDTVDRGEKESCMSFEPRETHERHQDQIERETRGGRRIALVVIAVLAAVGLALAIGALLRDTDTEEPAAFQPPDAAPPREEVDIEETLEARGIRFDRDFINLPEGTNVMVRFVNHDDRVTHNFALYRASDFTDPVFQGEPASGPTEREYIFEAPPRGIYFFRCDFHREEMQGRLEVR